MICILFVALFVLGLSLLTCSNIVVAFCGLLLFVAGLSVFRYALHKDRLPSWLKEFINEE